MKRFLSLLFIILGISLFLRNINASIFIDVVSVKDAGNSADPLTGYGAVEKNYKIGKTEVTVAQYCAFLNAVAKTDTYHLYNPRMAQDPNVASIQQIMNDGKYSYKIIKGAENFPITYVSWSSAARFCNWMQNNQPEGEQGPETTEQGAYQLNGFMGVVPVEKDAVWFLPSEDQWYKAAYYKGGSTNAGYWLYPTQHNSDPDNTLSETAVNGANFFAVKKGKDWLGNSTKTKTFSSGEAPYLTKVDAFKGSLGYYKTYDMGGNVFEWVDASRDGLAQDIQIIRGGAWGNEFWNNETGMESLRSTYRKNDYYSYSQTACLGFRVATQAQVFKPSFVTVGDPGNAADSTGHGAVESVYQIGKYPITASQYAIFLNAVASGSDPYHLYKPAMNDDAKAGSLVRSGYEGHYYYYAQAGRENFPINYVSWFEAARFCNWVHNDCLEDSENNTTTEEGAYTLQGKCNGSIVPVNEGARYFIPTQDQWYKAAYYKGGGTNSGYYEYPTQTDAAPDSSIGIGAHESNYNYNTQNASDYADSYLTSVKLFKNGRSSYGCYDMGGNVWEWNDTAYSFFGLEKIIVQGGSFKTSSASMGRQSSSALMGGAVDTGFRIAAPAVVTATSEDEKK